MAKRDRGTTEKKIKKWINEGRGQGEWENYKPWLTVQDVPSLGIAPRHKGWKTERVHHVMSKLELKYLYELEWSDEVEDIREQFPLLPLERTLEIADSLGIKHPTDPSTHEYIVMTTDFMVTRKMPNGASIHARTVKPTSMLRKREIEKFAIEQHFYREQGIDWAIVTDNSVDDNFISNMDFIYNAKYLDYFPGIDEKTVQQVSSILYKNINESSEPLSKVALSCDFKLGFEEGTCLFICKHLIANKVWEVDISKKINPMKKLYLLKDLTIQQKGDIKYG